MFSTMQENLKVLEEDIQPFQATEQSIVIPSVDDYLPDSFSVSLS